MNRRAASEGLDITSRVRQAVHAAVDRKALELRVLQVAELSGFTDFLLICGGTSERQVQAIADGVEERLGAPPLPLRPRHVEGYRHGCWVLLDYGDFVVHVFERETRDYYRLERLWAGAPDVTREFLE